QRAAALTRKATAAAFGAERATGRARADAATLDRASAAALERRRRDLDRILGTLAAHDPQRTLERGYALLEDADGEPITTAAAARDQQSLTIRLHDGRITARPETAAPAPPGDDAVAAGDAPEAAPDEAAPTRPDDDGTPADAIIAADESRARDETPSLDAAVHGDDLAETGGEIVAAGDEPAPVARRLRAPKPATAAGRAAEDDTVRLF
ncbi:hypothetical protein OJ997_28825, partial [Solirubrobacter phytolaccae]